MLTRPRSGLGMVLEDFAYFGFFLGLILVIFTPLRILEMEQARTWPSRQGVITHSSFSKKIGRRWAEHWSYTIRGRFTDTGESFTITQARSWDFTLFNEKTRVLETIAKYPAGRSVQVFFPPEDPSRLVLETPAPPEEMRYILKIGIGLLFLPLMLYAHQKSNRSHS